MMGNGRLEAHCFDGKKRLCHIRGKMRKRVWVNQGDIILIGLRDFQDEKADVIKKYNAEEARRLKKEGHLHSEWEVDDGAHDDRAMKDEDVGFDFTGAGMKDSDEELEKVQDQPDRYRPLPEYDESSSEEDSEESESESEEEEQYDYKNVKNHGKKDELDISAL